MFKMDDFTITYRENDQIKWLQYMLIGLGCIHLAIFGFDWWKEEANWISYLILIAAIGEILVGLFRYEEYFFPYPELTLTNDGLIVKENKNEWLIAWNRVQEITIDNKYITIVQDGGNEKINIQYLNYGDIQTAKKKLKQFTESRNVSYRSVY